ncbi:MAG: GlsB/YeaQ/YmgE family stress response membrane protein [Thermoguttaceae bacterium]
MPELSPVAQTWVYVVLIWIGFGSLAGLLSRLILPLEEPSGPLPTLTLGITGSAIGLGLLSWIQGGGPSNPICAVGFLAAVAGAFGLLLLYHLLRVVVHREPPPAAEEEEGGAGSGELGTDE